MRRLFGLGGLVLGLLLVSCGTEPLAARERGADKENAAAGAKEAAEEKPRSRRFRFDYGATISGLPEGARVRVWIPVASSGGHQRIKILSQNLPAEAKDATEPKHGNRIMYFEASGPKSGKLPLDVSYDVERREVRGLTVDGRPAKLSAAERKLLLSPDAMVPLVGKPLELIKDLDLPKDPVATGRKLYDRVDDHMRYDKSKPGYGRGDVLWACDSRFGNCSDFHSLFISLARSRGLPAKFEIGFPIPPERGQGSIGGYHCWAFFFADGQGWVPVDISEADKNPNLKEYYFGNLTEDRVTLSVGRDLELVPRQDAGPVNFLIYPYVEVDGKPWPGEKIEGRFAYEDQSRP